MKKVILIIFAIGVYVSISNAQIIPFGISNEKIYYEYSAADGGDFWTFGYYKPVNYNPSTSDIVIYFHGTGGDETEGYTFLKSIIDKRGSLLITPTNPFGTWPSAFKNFWNDTLNIYQQFWLSQILKPFYKHILEREGQTEISIRMLGFSAGGQCVTRYMLHRQAMPDSLPIKMAISMNPYYYTFPTEKYNNDTMFNWAGCGLYNDPTNIWESYYGVNCNEHIKGYYNENYTVLIGTADTELVPGNAPCFNAQGLTRYERAKNFYNFCQQDAIAKGTTLQWNYVEIPNIGHLGSQLSIAKANPTDTETILEHYLYDMPYHEPLKFHPTANFTYTIDEKKCVEFSAECECSWQLVPTTYTWDFGNNIKQTGVQALYEFSKNGTYTVTLYVENEYGKDTISKDIVVSTLPEISITPTNTTLIIPNTQASLTTESKNMFSLAWYLNDTYFSNESDFSYSFPNIGTYNVKAVVYNENGCVDTAFATIKTTESVGVSSIDDNSIIIQQKENTVTITSNNSPISKVQWFNIQGKEITLPIETGNTTEISYTTKDIKGIYTIVIFTKNERRTYKIHLN